MTNPANLPTDTILGFGQGFDCLAGAPLGRSEGQAVDIEACGRSDVLIACAATGGAEPVALDALPQMGAAGDGAALLRGATGVDTLKAAAASLPLTGRTVTFDLDATALGSNLLWVHSVPPGGLAVDLSVPFILHQVEHFSMLAPTPVGFRTGCAR